MMSASNPENGLPVMGTRSPSSSLDDDEESFVVLSNCVDEVTGQISSLQCTECLETVESSIPLRSEIQRMTNTEVLTATPLIENTNMCVSQESYSSGASELSAEEIHQKMENLLQENNKLKEILLQNNLAMKKQYDELVKWNTEAVEMKKIDSHLKAEEVKLKSKISALEFELDTLRQANAKYNIDQAKIIEDLGFKLSESEKCKFEESAKYKNQIDDLSSQLSHVELEYEKIKQELVVVKEKLPTETDAANIESMKEQLKELAQEVVLKNAMLKEKTDLIDQLHEAISKLEIEIKSIPRLKAQIESHQTYFNQKRQEKENLKSEKDQIAEDLRHLQRSNLKLLEQNEILQRDAFIRMIETFKSASSNLNAPTSESPPLKTFTCPICAHKFCDLASAEEHVEQCLLQNSSNS